MPVGVVSPNLEISRFPVLYTYGQKANMIHLDPNFINAIESLPQFIIDANADLDMAYDWVADQTGLDSFVHQQDAWDMFYDAYEKPLCLTDD